MATSQALKVAHRFEHGVETMGGQVKDVGDQVNCLDINVNDVDNKVNVVVEGTFSTLAQT
jgi:hypothetical protein